MIDYVVHNSSAIMLVFIAVIFINSLAFTLYKKRHLGKLPPRPLQITVIILLGNLIALGGVWLGVLVARTS